MNMNEYQREAMKTRLSSADEMYAVLGLCEEAGEVAGKVAKGIRDKGGEVDIEGLIKELGDVLWMVAAVCDSYDIDLVEVAEWNLRKLRDRQERNKLSGNGDSR